ncbi:aspartate aminotransferase [Plectosphaerella plurivora]|uniref:aspartate transaminase n=1 Tax=Plectosphaerella plurivora TaxID=936078 RepID=A0A9P8V3P3_9PEZI|nr:aspartate aminotransferase [Plectosphaerella plurivora]
MATQTITAPPETTLSLFSSLPPPNTGGPFALEADFKADTNQRKVNLIIGAYRDDDAQPWSLRSVTAVGIFLAISHLLLLQAKTALNVADRQHEYPPLRGDDEFLRGAKHLVFGAELVQTYNSRLASIQTVSGTGANSLIAKFLKANTRASTVWLPDPTWVNHADIWADHAGGIRVREYPYYNNRERMFDFTRMMACLNCEARQGDIVLLHACAHNPTGLDPSEDQWREIAAVCERKKLFVVFDLAYQGFTTGDLDADAWAVRYFLSNTPLEFAVCQSFSKNLGLYSERVGALHFAVSRSGISTAASVEARLIDHHRANVSVAPTFGCRVAVEIFKSPELQALWAADLAEMSGRIRLMRRMLHDELVRLGTPGSWDHIVEQVGMFSYTGLSAAQVQRLREEYSVYMMPSGRASMCGLTTGNVAYTAWAIHNVVTETSG